MWYRFDLVHTVISFWQILNADKSYTVVRGKLTPSGLCFLLYFEIIHVKVTVNLCVWQFTRNDYVLTNYINYDLVLTLHSRRIRKLPKILVQHK